MTCVSKFNSSFAINVDFPKELTQMCSEDDHHFLQPLFMDNNELSHRYSFKIADSSCKHIDYYRDQLRKLDARMVKEFVCAFQVEL